MSLDLFQEETNQRLTGMQPVENPPPGTWDGFARGAGMLTMRAMAQVPRAVSLVGSIPAIVGDAFSGGTELQDKYFRAHDDNFQSPVDYWTPKANEVGFAGQVTGGLLGFLPQVLANPALAVGTIVAGSGEDVLRAGATPGEAAAVGAVQGAGQALGIWLPILGPSSMGLWQRIGIGAATNLGQGVATRGASQVILRDGAAKDMFHAFDPAEMTTDALLGMAFGSFAHISPEARQQGAESWARIQRWAERLSPSDKAAIAGLREAQHLNVDSAPGAPVGLGDLDAHVQRMRAAIDQLARGEPVAVEDIRVPAAEPAAPARDTTQVIDPATGQPARDPATVPPIEDLARERDPQFHPNPERQVEAEAAAAQLAEAAEVVRSEDGIADLHPVRNFIEDALFNAGRNLDEVKAGGALWEAFYRTQAKRMGMSEQALWERFPLRGITNDMPGGEALNRLGQRPLDEATGLPLNADGTVTVWHHTSGAKAAEIRRSGELQSAAEPDVYVTSRREADTGYGDTAVPIRVRPDQLHIDDEFPDGRKDFRLSVGKPGGRIKVNVNDVLEQPYTRAQLERMDIDDLDRMAYGVASGDTVTLAPGKIKIKYPGDLENPQDKFNKEGMAWVRSVDFSEPVEVSVNQKGEFELEDGHHRWFAAQKLGRKLKAVVEVKGKPIEVILGRQGDTLEQESMPQRNEGMGPRGYMERSGEGVTIGLLKNADASTFLHESGHFFLDTLAALGRDEGVPRDLRADLDNALKWMGVEDPARWDGMTLEEKRPFHEKFARGFEAYLRDGEAPTPELKGIFERFKEWLTEVYKTALSLNIDLSPDIRGIMDRMLGGEKSTTAPPPARPKGSSSSSPKPGEAAGADGARGLDDPDARRVLENMAAYELGWAEVGGRIIRSGEGASADEMAMGRAHESGEVVGRTKWVPNAEWWPARPDKLNADQVREAVRKALAGEKLKKAEQRTVDFMLNEANDRLRIVDEVGGQPEFDALAGDLDGLGMEATPDTILNVDRVARAAELDEAQVERAAQMYENDTPAFMREIDRILNEADSKTATPGRQGGEGEAPSLAAREAIRVASEKPQALIHMGDGAEPITIGEYLDRAYAEAQAIRDDIPLLEVAAQCLLGAA